MNTSEGPLQPPGLGMAESGTLAEEGWPSTYSLCSSLLSDISALLLFFHLY